MLLKRLVMRDVVIAMVTLLAWQLDARYRHTGTTMAITLGVATGLLTGLCGYLGHEWGHLVGALVTRSVVHYPSVGQSPLSFHFDTAKNDRRQFYWMSGGGYVASIVGLALIVTCVPHDWWSGWIAMTLAGLGTIAIFGAELPITVRVLRGAPLPTGFAYGPP